MPLSACAGSGVLSGRTTTPDDGAIPSTHERMSAVCAPSFGASDAFCVDVRENLGTGPRVYYLPAVSKKES